MLSIKEKLQHINSIAHEGKVVVVGTDANGEIWYTVKQDGFEDSYLNQPTAERTGWEDWKQLELPNEDDDNSVIAKEKEELTYQDGNKSIYLLRSLYKTKDQSAVAPVQLVSGLGYIYIFRQSKSGTLLVDRFVLDGLTNTLTRKLEVRFKRSKQKHTPSKNQQKGATGLVNVDSLDFVDINGKAFYESTTELSLINNLANGWFSVVLLPTNEQDKFRWHIFAYNNQNQKVELTTLRASDEGLFEVKDYTILDPEPRSIPGVIKRTLNLGAVTVVKGLTATKYDLQKEVKTDDGEMQLLRESVHVMLVVGTSAGNVTAISFAVAGDGTLSQIQDTPDSTTVQRSMTHQILLPLNTLDEIRAIGTSNPPPQGVITGFARGEGDGVVITSNQATKLDEIDITQVKVKDNTDYNRLYSQVTKIDKDTFEITPENASSGSWEVVLEEETGLIFNGLITAYEITPTGKLKVTSFNHGLDSGDAVQVVDTKNYNGTYFVTKIDDKTFSLDGVMWQAGIAISAKLQTQKRRGIIFDGVDDYIALPRMNHDFSLGITVEAWVWYDSFNSWSRIIDFSNGTNGENILFANESTSSNLQIVVCQASTQQRITATGALEAGKWMHLAATIDASGSAKLYKNGNEIAIDSVPLSNPMSCTNSYIGRSNQPSDGYFDGKIGDVRIWNKARTADEIKNSMYLQMTGKEVSLVGYWRLDAIVEDQERKVIDFSIYGNDGVVQGGACVSSVTLDRNLARTTTPAVKYENEELFAVSEWATYTEEFEFKTNNNIDPNNADGDKIFALTYKGKKNRRSQNWIDITSVKATQFTHSEGNWYKASSCFTVQKGVSVVRSFGIEAIKGRWTTLEIRKHKVYLVSDSITEAKYTDAIADITTLVDNQVQLQESLEQLGIKESQEGSLLKERKELQAQIKLLSLPLDDAIKIKQAEFDAQQNNRNSAISQRDFWDAENQRGTQSITLYEHGTFAGRTLRKGLGQHDIGTEFNDIVTSVKVPSGLKVTLRQHSDGSGKTLTLTGDTPDVGSEMNDRTSSIEVETINGNTDLAYVQRQSANWQNQVSQEQAKLSKLQQELDDLKTDKDRKAKSTILNNLLTQVEQELTQVQEDLKALNNTLINGVQTTQQTSQAMPTLKTDSRGLVTQAALLGFVHPVSRLSAIETCEGNIQLSYFDTQGRMRQTNFDATADSEQWIPDALRPCLNFNNNSSVVTLNLPIYLKEEWTIEAWFAYPLAETIEWNTLIRGNGMDCHIIVKRESNAERLGIYLQNGGGFVDSGYDMRQLAPGWYHLTAVAQGKDKEAKTTFYINGSKVREANGKTTSNVYAIGNLQTGGQQFGKVAEVRIWGVALSADEIAVNSKTVLTGNEPGLLAYYPFNEAKDTTVKNQTGGSSEGTITGASWWGCAAPIGNLGHQVMQFDGVDDHIALPQMDHNFSQGITVEAWVWYDSFKSWSRIIDFGNGRDSENILFANESTSNTLRFNVCQGSAQQSIAATGALETGKWMHLAATIDASGSAKLYKNGNQIGTGSVALPKNLNRTNNYIGRSNWDANGYFDGKIGEVRIWNKACTQSEIQATLNKRLTGKESGLVAYYPLSSITSEDLTTKVLDLVNNNQGTVTQAILIADQTLPICGDALVSCEYSTVSKDRSVMMRRFYATPTSQGINLLPDKRIEQVELKWIGNGQFAPTLLGYIEGAPPIPSENLTIEKGYNGATSVELILSEDVAFNWRRSQNSGLGAAAEIFAGADAEASAGFGFTAQVAKVRSGFKGSLDFSYQFQNESSITASSSLSMADKLQLVGTQEQKANFPQIGKRFIPKNVGYALVVSALADVFVTCLKRTGKMIGYQVLPVENIPPDVNTITFLINPAYTMSGSLDGMTGSLAASQRFFKHVPAMRAQFGSLYPASYYRLQEAYDLKKQIEQQDKNREAYFAQFNSLLVDEASLDRETNKGDTPGEISVNRPENKSEDNLTDEQKKAASKERQAKLEQETDAAISKQSKAEKKKRAAIDQTIQDEQKKSHAAASFASWQTKMEDIQIRAGKCNIVNTYVWDTDGGLRTEAQSFANTAEHSIGGSFSLNASLGFEGKFAGGGVGVELTAQATVNLTQTMMKTETRSRGIQLNVDLGGVESRSVTDYNDYPMLPGEKVNRYRFMSFYLEGSTNNFNDFFSYVVDPEWLASNSEEARALRQAKGKANKAWRVLHRVTYVERPALMGFGRDIRQLPAAESTTDLGQLQAKVDKLEKDNAEIQRKLDAILKKLSS